MGEGGRGKGRCRPKHTPRILTARKREKEAFEAKVRGCTWQQVADEVGYAHGRTAQKAVKRYVASLGPGPDAEEYRVLLLERTEALLYAIWPKAMGYEDGEGNWHDPSPKHVQIALNLINRTAELTGAKAPVTMDVAVTHTNPLEGIPIGELATFIKWLQEQRPAGQLKAPTVIDGAFRQVGSDVDVVANSPGTDSTAD